ncbi:helix-turn-helix transcriptional regulator [Aliifodinibius sp. S!AR15-10]|uniref:helix-turn-helix domain-containing protein n=1 Tax=Aliifodinibius sp. S!AR15-10 TaxID=2950437 RepID=UPI00285EC3FD|nr:helix-turn-helix domain-containing protein [Aliifodinibius sp. S!AR15-10]MDR8393793.1 helix-turn-helix transcriptional regulator [Aliifodinibius sp. S!AR15-10]
MKKKSGEILQENVQYLLEEYYEGNVSKMQRGTGVNRSVLSELKNGTKTEVNSSTLVRLAESGINLNWLLTGTGTPFTASDQEEAAELGARQLLDNRTTQIKKLTSEIEALLSAETELRLDRDVQTALLELLKTAVR